MRISCGPLGGIVRPDGERRGMEIDTPADLLEIRDVEDLDDEYWTAELTAQLPVA